MELQPGEVTIVNANFGGLGTGFIKYNITQTMQTTILTNSSAQDTENLTAIQPTIDDKLQAFGSNATDSICGLWGKLCILPITTEFPHITSIYLCERDIEYHRGNHKQ